MNKALLIFAIFAFLSLNCGVSAIENCLLVPVNNSNFFNLCPFARADRYFLQHQQKISYSI